MRIFKTDCAIHENNDPPLNARPESKRMPSQTSSNSVMTTATIPVLQDAFLHVIIYHVTEYQTVYAAIKKSGGHLTILCDEGDNHLLHYVKKQGIWYKRRLVSSFSKLQKIAGFYSYI